MELELKVSSAKACYNDALKNLEQISEEIHKMREERRLSNDMVENYDVRKVAMPKIWSDKQIKNSRFQNDECIDTSTNISDEYLDFPSKLSIESSPIRQKNIEKLDCPHLLRDFVSYPQQGSSTELISPSKIDGVSARMTKKNHFMRDQVTGFCYTPNSSRYHYLHPDVSKQNISDSFQTFVSNDDIEQWTEIRLSNSESSSSGYSQHSHIDDKTPTTTENSSLSSVGGHPKVTCTTIFSLDDNVTTGRKDDEHFTNWITKSNAKNSSRRQSLDILIDASDKVKDVFTLSFQKVGKSLERRSSESEVSSDSSDFFSFTR